METVILKTVLLGYNHFECQHFCCELEEARTPFYVVRGGQLPLIYSR